jgi:iron complex transport system substrate-binding protein
MAQGFVNLIRCWRRKALKNFIYLVLTGLTFLVITACTPQPDSNSSPTADCRPIQHAMGESCVPQSPNRVVTLSLPTLANMIALEIQPIGAATYDAFAGIKVTPYLEDKVDGIEWVGTDDQPSLEKLAQLSPDLILGLKRQHEQIYPQLSQIAPTVLFDVGDRSNWKQLGLEVAAVFGQTPQAEQLLQDYSDRVEQLREQLGETGLQQEVSIAYAIGTDIYSDVKNSFPGSILEDIGLRRPPSQDVTASNNGRLIFSQERIDSIDGDVLFVPKSGNELDRDQDELMQKPLWQTLEVVQQERVYRVNLWNWTGLDILAAHEVLNDLFQYLVNDDQRQS